MYQPIDDPVQDLIDFTKHWLFRMRLSFLDANEIIEMGESMKIPNQYGALTICFERLESEPEPRRVAQLNRRSRERKLQQQLAGTVQFCASLFVSSKHR
jgi:hypothetical protein